MQSTKYYYVARAVLGNVKLFNTALVALTSYLLGKGLTDIAALIGIIYAVSKDFVQMSEIKDKADGKNG